MYCKGKIVIWWVFWKYSNPNLVRGQKKLAYTTNDVRVLFFHAIYIITLRAICKQKKASTQMIYWSGRDMTLDDKRMEFLDILILFYIKTNIKTKTKTCSS